MGKSTKLLPLIITQIKNESGSEQNCWK